MFLLSASFFTIYGMFLPRVAFDRPHGWSAWISFFTTLMYRRHCWGMPSIMLRMLSVLSTILKFWSVNSWRKKSISYSDLTRMYSGSVSMRSLISWSISSIVLVLTLQLFYVSIILCIWSEVISSPFLGRRFFKPAFVASAWMFDGNPMSLIEVNICFCDGVIASDSLSRESVFPGRAPLRAE